jgi:hypothetical protein
MGLYSHFIAENHRFQGIAEVENEEHCDFKILRDMLIRTHMQVMTGLGNLSSKTGLEKTGHHNLRKT